ncbi:hypothetical protein MMC13_008230 [Lambiella insularis]|nr:hypothetical protein [Lambiella insularis]
MDDATRQLQNELHGSIKYATKTRRPVLTHINADTTWLIQFPFPASVTPPIGRTYFNILLDPWLSGLQSDFAWWFSTQWHAIPSSVQTIAELDQRLRDVEEVADLCDDDQRNYHNNPSKRLPLIDAVIISHEFTDHMHKPTLLEIPSTVPVFATQKAASSIRSWKHFTRVHLIAPASLQDMDWRKTSIAPLPNWIGLSRIVTRADPMYLHSAILITFDLGTSRAPRSAKELGSAEAIIYTPHGISPDELRPLSKAAPAIETLALLHGFNEVDLSVLARLNLGAHNGVRAQRASKARYWVGTHDEAKAGSGILLPLLRRKELSPQGALLELDADDRNASDYSSSDESLQVVALKSGESLTLFL